MNALEWTVDRLSSALQDIQAKARAEWAALGANGARLAQDYERAKRISDPATRQQVMAELEGWAARQATLTRAFTGFMSTWRGVLERARQFLAAHGLTLNVNTSLGALPLVPVVLVTAVATAAAVVAAIALANRSMSKGIDEVSGIVDAWSRGQLTDNQARTALAAVQQMVDTQLRNVDPLGLSRLVQVVVPLGLVVLAMIYLPPLLRGIGGRRA